MVSFSQPLKDHNSNSGTCGSAPDTAASETTVKAVTAGSGILQEPGQSPVPTDTIVPGVTIRPAGNDQGVGLPNLLNILQGILNVKPEHTTTKAGILDHNFLGLIDIDREKIHQGPPEIPPELPEESEDDDGIDALRRKGFNRLAELKASKNGEPWDAIWALNHVTLEEQIAELVLLCEAKTGETYGQQAKTIVEYCLKKAQEALEQQRQTIGEGAYNDPIETAIALIGKVSFLTNRNVSDAAVTVSAHNDTSAVLMINAKFNKALQRVTTELNKHFDHHAKTEMQPAEQAYRTQVPVAVARLIMMDTGAINYGIIQSIEDRFLSANKPHRGAEVNLAIGLSVLKRSPEMREKFLNIHAPQEPGAVGKLVIQHSLRLRADDEIDDGDARLAVLTGILSHPRQGLVGSCFASFLTIEVMVNHIERCTDDLIQLVQDGKITLVHKGVEEEFPFLPHMAHDDCDKKVTLNRFGELMTRSGREAYIWESPGIRAACRAVGIPEDEMESVVLEAVQMLFKVDGDNSMRPKTVTANQIISALAQHIHNKDPNSHGTTRQLMTKLIFAFEAQTSNPLLRAWENAIAAMAERENDGIMKQRLLASVLILFGQRLQSSLPADEEKRDLITAQFFEALQKRLRIQYDPSFEGEGIANDGHSRDGAFVAYDTDGKSDPKQWIEVDTAEKFQTFVGRLLEEAKTNTLSGIAEEDQGPILSAFLALEVYVKGDEFPANAASLYNYGQILPPSFLPSLNNMEHTPWVDHIGNNPNKIWEFYFDVEEAPKAIRVHPRNAEGLLTCIIEMLRKAPEKAKKFFAENPYAQIPARTPGSHAFSITPGDPGLKDAWQSDLYVGEWIQENLVAPGKKVAETVVPGPTRQAVINACSKHYVSKRNRAAFLEAASKLPEELWYSDFRGRLLTIIETLEHTRSDRTARSIDTTILRHMPDKTRSSLLNSSIKFADSNWNEGARDILFAFMYNPFSNKLEMWQAYDDDSLFIAMDQAGWITHQPWEFYADVGETVPGQTSDKLDSRILDLIDLLIADDEDGGDEDGEGEKIA